MRQRLLVLKHGTQIEHIEIPATGFAFPKPFGLSDWLASGLNSDDLAASDWCCEAGDFGHGINPLSRILRRNPAIEQLDGAGSAPWRRAPILRHEGENGTGMLVGVRQGVALMGAIKVMERKLIDGSFKHRLSRMMTWCAGNAVTQQTGTGMRIARDASGYGKIDPLVAGFMCFAEMMLNPKPENGPIIL